MEKNQNLSLISVALMYVSTIMGAGFASGRETWQYFGVFGAKGFLGVVLVSVLFALMGGMTAYIARALGTSDMGKIIVPQGHDKLSNIVGIFMAVFLFSVLLSLTAAGSSILNQQFGVPVGIGGIIIDLMVIATIIGGFERISKVFKYIMPVLFATVLISAAVVIIVDIPKSGLTNEVVPSEAVPNWVLGAALYISFNSLAMIPFVAKSAVNARSQKAGVVGSLVGGVFLGVLDILIVIAIQQDMPFSDAMDLPMLAYATKAAPILGIWYFIVLFFSIYSSATSNFYGCTTKIQVKAENLEDPESLKLAKKKKNKIVVGLAILAYICGLIGFKATIAYMYAVEGYVGFMIIALLTINFFKVKKGVSAGKCAQNTNFESIGTVSQEEPEEQEEDNGR